MQNLKVWTFHPTARNTLMFILLSFLFLILQKSLHSNLPFMNMVFLKKFLVDEWPVIVASLPAVVLVYRHQAHSRFAFSLFCAIITFKSLEGLFLNFNKVLMVVLFVYVCMSYAFYQLLLWSFTRAVFAPNYEQDALHEPMSHKIPLELQCGELVRKGYLTNWDQEGAFVFLDEAWPAGRSKVDLELVFEGHTFKAKGSVVSATWDSRGIGVEWSKATVPEGLSWNALMDLFNDLGWMPQLLR